MSLFRNRVVEHDCGHPYSCNDWMDTMTAMGQNSLTDSVAVIAEEDVDGVLNEGGGC